MPKSKSAELRIKVIDQCLSDQNRKYSTEMIFKRCNEELERRDFVPITAMNSVRADMEQIERIYPGAEIESYREGSMENFTPLFNAIVDKQPRKLSYQSFKQDRKEIIVVHPYYLKQYNKRWFLIAWNEDKGFLANYAFDRIMHIKNARIKYRPTDINFFDYFDDMIGVSKDSRTEPQKVKLWVSMNPWPYVRTKPLHGATQKLVNMDETGAYITIEVYLNYELEQQILSFGENMRVIEPVELKERIKQRLSDAIVNYVGKVQNE